MNDCIKYITVLLLSFTFLLKGAVPVLQSGLLGKSQLEMPADFETEENKKTSRPFAETELPELYIPLHSFTNLTGCSYWQSLKKAIEQNTAYKQKIIIAIPTPPPENV